MKALRFYAPGDVRLEDVPEPVAGPDEVKIRVRNCSTCGTDVKIRNNGHPNITRVTTMGHEIAGEVVEVGADALGGFQVGDRVQVIAAVPCGECHECRKGWMEVCENQTSIGYQYDGGFAEYMIVPAAVLKVDGLNHIPGRGRFSTRLRLRSPSRARSTPRSRSASRRATSSSSSVRARSARMHVRIARGVHKAGTIILIDINAERLKMTADAVHPDITIDGSSVNVVEEVLKLTKGRGADVIITATPANITQEQAVAMAARNGRISFFGGLPKNNPTIALDSNLVHYRQLHIHGANGSAPEHHKRALAYIASGQIPVKDLITRHVPLADALEAFDIVARGEAIKVTVEP